MFNIIKIASAVLLAALVSPLFVSQGEATVVTLGQGQSITANQSIPVVLVYNDGTTTQQQVYYDSSLNGVNVSTSANVVSLYFPTLGVRYLLWNGNWVNEQGAYWYNGNPAYVTDPNWGNYWNDYWGRNWNNIYRAGWDYRHDYPGAVYDANVYRDNFYRGDANVYRDNFYRGDANVYRDNFYRGDANVYRDNFYRGDANVYRDNFYRGDANVDRNFGNSPLDRDINRNALDRSNLEDRNFGDRAGSAGARDFGGRVGGAGAGHMGGGHAGGRR